MRSHHLPAKAEVSGRQAFIPGPPWPGPASMWGERSGEDGVGVGHPIHDTN